MPKLCSYVDDNGDRCTGRAAYGIKNGIPETCKEHKEDNYVDSRSKICIVGDCLTRATFGVEGTKTKLHCSEHREEDEVNVANKKCEHPGCVQEPTYGSEWKRPVRCKKHKLENDFDVKHRRCEVKGCMHRPTFGTEWKKALRCKKHKLEDDTNVNDKRCEFSGCDTLPSFGIEKGKPLRCVRHKLVDDFNVVRRVHCNFPNCNKNPSHGYEKSKPLYCATHREDDMKLTYGICKSNEKPYCIDCPQRGNRSYNGFCTHCFSHLFPDNPKTLMIQKKSKELQVLSYLYSISSYFKHDKPLHYGSDCPSMRRVDAYLHANGVLLCIEIDENQHKSYNADCERHRYDDLFFDYGGKMMFIRFNPDSYKDSNGKRKNPLMDTRLKVLKKEIIKQLHRIKNNEIQDLVEEVKLYYDGYT